MIFSIDGRDWRMSRCHILNHRRDIKELCVKITIIVSRSCTNRNPGYKKLQENQYLTFLHRHGIKTNAKTRKMNNPTPVPSLWCSGLLLPFQSRFLGGYLGGHGAGFIQLQNMETKEIPRMINKGHRNTFSFTSLRADITTAR
jgi:hypothetical protein